MCFHRFGFNRQSNGACFNLLWPALRKRKNENQLNSAPPLEIEKLGTLQPCRPSIYSSRLFISSFFYHRLRDDVSFFSLGRLIAYMPFSFSIGLPVTLRRMTLMPQ